MSNYSLSANCERVEINPRAYREIDVTMDISIGDIDSLVYAIGDIDRDILTNYIKNNTGVIVGDTFEDVLENIPIGEILDYVGVDDIINEYNGRNCLDDVLNQFDDDYIIDYMRKKGYELFIPY